jgi:hypothetical protein
MLISQALKRNTKLCTLWLHTNNFTSIGVKALLSCIFDGSSLNDISESNHTLAFIHMFSQGGNELLGYIDRMLDLGKLGKIVLALNDKDSLLKYLANVPVGLIPEVLALPLWWVGIVYKNEYLNIVYSTMRWWNMPSLYLYQCCVKSDTKRKRVD